MNLFKREIWELPIIIVFIVSVYVYLIYLRITDFGDIHTSVENVVLSIECLYDVLMSINVKLVVVGFLFDRSQVMMRRGLSVNEYNARVDSLSLLLYDTVKIYFNLYINNLPILFFQCTKLFLLCWLLNDDFPPYSNGHHLYLKS
jgi:hypothetical protein